MDKKELRKFYKSKRLDSDRKEKKILDKNLQKNFLESEEYKNCQNILVYVSSEIEVDTGLIISQSLGNKNVYCPRCHKSGIGMDFYRIESISQLEKGMYGIREPKENLPRWDKCVEGNTLCVVPGLSFDSYGYRLGFGKGYYDRFLCEFDGIKIGLCYENCLCEKLPVFENDIRADKLVTEKKIYDFRVKITERM